MSRITLSLKKQVHIPEGGTQNWSSTGGAFDLQFSRDRSFSDATIRTRSRGNSTSDYFTGGADTGVNFGRPPQLRRLSTICSAQSSPVSMSSDIADMLWSSGKGRENPEHLEMEVTHIRTTKKGDEEAPL